MITVCAEMTAGESAIPVEMTVMIGPVETAQGIYSHKIVLHETLTHKSFLFLSSLQLTLTSLSNLMRPSPSLEQVLLTV